MRRITIFAIAFLSAITAASGQILQQEPLEGRLAPGQRVLVDDGRCPKGKISEVTGGGNRKIGTGLVITGNKRQRRCIARR
jgi:hypothetical protein